MTDKIRSHPADAHDRIQVIGARENNLKDISLRLPKRRLTVFTGVSGSGKSSLVFGTIAAESQRMINETYSSFVQGFMPNLPRPDVDDLQGLTTAIIVDQERLGANVRSTLGTVTDIHALLRNLFSRAGTPRLNSPQAFSFNTATVSGKGAITLDTADGKKTEARSFSIQGGMCPTCEGTGTVSDFDLDALFDKTKSLNEGAITVPGYSMDGWYGRIFRGSGFFDADKKLGKFNKNELHDLLYKEPIKIKVDGINVTYEGIIPKIQKSFLTKDPEAMQAHIRSFVSRAVVQHTCPDCGGSRLNETARSVKVAGKNLAEVCELELIDVAAWLETIPSEGIAPLLDRLRQTLAAFIDIGLGYLSLNRSAGTLSGGEAQRTKLVRHLNSALTDVTYVFDEPTIGLHPHDIQRLNTLLLQLRDKGNTVLVVEHKPETIAIADHVVDLGPGAGNEGGRITFEGDVAGLRASATLTGRHLDDRASLKEDFRSPTEQLQVRGCTANNVRNLDVDIPLGVLTVITGVAGSGKSTLIDTAVLPHPDTAEKIAYLDQSPIRGSRRSNPATYTGLLDPIRKAFAKANGVKPGMFSANSEGACPACKGNGVIYTDLGFMAGFETTCEECAGQGFQEAVLAYHFGDKNIAQVMAMSATEAAQYFAAPETKIPAATKILQRIVDVGLGYMTLGQALSTLSGGERQRLKLAAQLADKAEIYVLDEPTTGLHMADVQHLLALLDQLVDAGKSVIVIEHHQAVMAHADWIIDMGPGAGADGGRVVFTGTPADLINKNDTLTAKHLAEYVSASN
ncbi:ATP-binding cassette domain-containing protein [Micrococcoides hystricis]|uniref:UvrABC system protein A n=1 Tax=Micrococcoides hystricis TaxID=1572761 RepID=A0ABV6P7B8_9MICC